MPKLAVAALLLVLVQAPTRAEQAVAGAPSTAAFQELWESVVLDGEADGYPFVKARGRYHGQHYWVDAGDEGSSDDWEHRRIRLGLDVRFSDRFEFAFDFNMDRGNDGPLIDDFDFIAFDWRVNDSTAVSFGKLRRNPLTREDSISSNRILTIERSLITSRFFIDNVGGVFAVHERGDWAFGGGILSGSVDEDNLALPTLEGSLALKGNLGYRITDATELRLDYLYNPGDPDNNEIQPYRHVVSLNSYSRWNRFGLITDLIFADALPEAPGDLFSVVVLPHYMLTPRLQAVARYTWVSSSSVDGVRLARRYERAVSQLREGRGDRYQAWYAGLNYYIYGHKLKLMSGVEYTTLARPGSDYSGVTASAALRFYF